MKCYCGWSDSSDSIPEVASGSVADLVTDDERRRVLEDMLSYRLLPNPVIDYLNDYLGAMDEERES
jgi:hypothetical protein